MSALGVPYSSAFGARGSPRGVEDNINEDKVAWIIRMRIVSVILIGIVAPPDFIPWVDEPIDEVIVITEILETGQSRTAV
ncbi:hypothetical protein FQR65_LT11458 [Abscondita terminalis]|nr:hypothetical protein FQR65_LT11458 [Abscondita terminalis]